MDREKQIEEIRCENCIHHFACRLNGEYDPSPCRAYEDKAGYRKQSEGEWVKHTDEYDCEYATCSCCGEDYYDSTEDTIDMFYNYCPNCGVKMKRGNK